LFKGALATVGRIFSGRETGADLRARVKEYRGDAQVSKVFGDLPRGWRVFHDINLVDEVVDHVVTGPRGVFNIEMSIGAGTVVANPRGLYTHGHRNHRLVEQAMRRARALEKQLGVDVQPVLAVVGADLTGREVDGLPVVVLDELSDFLLSDDGRRLTWDQAKRVLDTLGALTR
jgi:hypothetical protein